MTEAQRTGETVTGFARCGVGVMLCAAMVLLVTDQVKLSRLLGIGRKMRRHNETDMTGMVDEKILRYLTVAEISIASVEWGIGYLTPFTEACRNVKQAKGDRPSAGKGKKHS
jgi:hypothetical protein